jgi:hypothetical protein
MQRRYAALVDRVRVGASSNEVNDHLALRIRIHIVRARPSIRGVVERFGSPPVPGANRGALPDERLGKPTVMRGGGDMQGRVARVDLVTNRDQEVGTGILAGRPSPKRIGGQARRLTEHPRHPGVISGSDRSKQRKQRTVAGLAGSPACLRHDNRLPYLERGRS